MTHLLKQRHWNNVCHRVKQTATLCKNSECMNDYEETSQNVESFTCFLTSLSDQRHLQVISELVTNFA